MKKLIIAALFATGLYAGIEAAPTDAVTQADLKALIERINKLEAENKAQAAKIQELEKRGEAIARKADSAEVKVAKISEAVDANAEKGEGKAAKADEGTEVSESGKIYTTKNGKQYYLADASARIFEPLSESGLQITPYAYMVLEGVYSDRQLEGDYTTDWVSRNTQKRNHTTLSVQDSIMGVQFMTPELNHGWKFSGKAEFDLVGLSEFHQNDYGFHWRHLYVDADHAESGWKITFGQTWHLWKMVTPSEIDGAWMENTGHPYRRSPQIRVTKTFNFDDSSLELRAGIVKGGPGMGEDRDWDGIQDNTASPWVLFEGAALYDHVAPWQESKDDRWLVGVGGQWGRNRSHRYNGFDFNGQEDDYDSMMGMLAASLPIWKFKLCGQFYAGENLGGVQAGCGQTVSFHNYGLWGNGYVRGNEVRTIGGFVDLSYQITDDWSAAVGYGCDDPVDSDIEGGVNHCGILFNDRLYVAAFYQVTGNFKLGLEYARLMTGFADTAAGAGDGADITANRVQFSAFYDF